MAKGQTYFFGLGFPFVGIWRVRPSDDDCMSLERLVIPDGAQFVFDQVLDQEVRAGDNPAAIWIGSKGMTGQQPNAIAG